MEPPPFAALLAPSVSLAGLLMVVVGFVRARIAELKTRGLIKREQLVAKIGLVPIALAFLCAFLAVLGMSGCAVSFPLVTTLFLALLPVSLLYAVVLIFRL